MASPSTQTQASSGTLIGRLFQPVDGLWLAWFRVSYGVTLLYWARHYLSSNVFEQYYELPRYHFPYFGFEWVQALSPDNMTRLFVAIQVLSVLVILGVMYRVSSLLLGLAFCYVFLVDRAFYQNHYYLLSLIGLILPWLPCHRTWSIDAWIRPGSAGRRVPAWSLYLLRFLVAVPYIYGGIAKINFDWLAGQPMRMVLSGLDWHPVIGPWVNQEWLVMSFVWGGLLFDLLIVPAIVWKRTRLVALAASLVFHLMNATMFHIGVFPWFMIAATLILLPTDSIPRMLRRSIPTADDWQLPAQWWQRTVVTVLALLVVFQLVWPFRHHVMAGDVNWNEHGHYFSWRMKLRGKTSALRFEAYDPATGALDWVNPQRWLTDFQVNRMARDPRMVHDFARFLQLQYLDQGYPQTQIRALVLVSLNGRKPQLMIDPKVDLGSLPSSWTAPTFVVPLKEPLRHDAWDEPRMYWSRHLPEKYQQLPKASERDAERAVTAKVQDAVVAP